LPLTDAERSSVISSSILAGHYERMIDRESAYEKLKETAAQAAPVPEASKSGREPASESAKMLQAMAKSAAHAIGSQVGRQIIRGVLGSIFGKGRR
jgi:predicted RNA-binding Zn ribbon-like protein